MGSPFLLSLAIRSVRNEVTRTLGSIAQVRSAVRFGGENMRRSLTFLFGVFLIAIFHIISAGAAKAQGGATGAISGQVVDSSGSSIADAEVQIINAGTGTLVRKVPTASDGTFVATLLPPGSYYLVVNKSGFAEAQARGVEIRVTETTKVTIPLKPGSVS